MSEPSGRIPSWRSNQSRGRTAEHLGLPTVISVVRQDQSASIGANLHGDTDVFQSDKFSKCARALNRPRIPSARGARNLGNRKTKIAW